MNNPALMLGSDFPGPFQAYYKVGDWDMLLKLTSTASRKRYGDAGFWTLQEDEPWIPYTAHFIEKH